MQIIKMNKFGLLIAVILAAALVLTSCSGININKDSGKISIVTTIFPSYDFAREIIGDEDADIKMLLKPGSEAHSYEPTPQDIIAIQNCDVFVYVGGESDEWVKNILSSVDTSEISIVSMMDCVDAVEEEIVEGMQAELSDDYDLSGSHEDKHDESLHSDKEEPDTDFEETPDSDDDGAYEPEYDEHVWTSPLNAVKIVQSISEAIVEKDLSNAEYYQKRTQDYIQKLTELDNEFRDIVNNAKIRTIIFGDRFPCRYFADEYGLKYYAAFPGCSSETEASAKTVSFLIDKVNDEGIPVVLYPELSNKKVATTICESTGAKYMQFNSCHNVTNDEFENGVSYLSLMQENVKVIEEALNDEAR